MAVRACQAELQCGRGENCVAPTLRCLQHPSSTQPFPMRTPYREPKLNDSELAVRAEWAYMPNAESSLQSRQKGAPYFQWRQGSGG